MVSKYDKHIKFLIVMAYIVLGIFTLHFFFTKLLIWIMPFILAFGFAYFIDPLVNFLEKKCRIPRKISSFIALIFALLLLGSIVTFIIDRVVVETGELAKQLPLFLRELPGKFSGLNNRWALFNNALPADISALLNTWASDITSLAKPLSDATKQFAAWLPQMIASSFIFLIAMLLGTYFISSDKERIANFIIKQMPLNWYKNLLNVKDTMFFALFKYIKAQLILMSITFVELLIGFTIIGVRYQLLLALCIALIDAMPILGTGTALIPWSLYLLFTGQYKLGISILILYGIVHLVRQVLEPKILGHQIGMYPLVTLVAMYIGLNTFGFLGLILFPVIILIMKNFTEQGTFKFWRC